MPIITSGPYLRGSYRRQSGYGCLTRKWAGEDGPELLELIDNDLSRHESRAQRAARIRRELESKAGIPASREIRTRGSSRKS